MSSYHHQEEAGGGRHAAGDGGGAELSLAVFRPVATNGRHSIRSQ